MKKIMRTSDSAIIANQLTIADTFTSRLKGLIGTREFSMGQGLYFPRCNSIHMWFMSIPIDVVFLKKEHDKLKVVRVCSNLKPWKCFPVSAWNADDVLELPSGTIVQFSLKNEEVLCIAS